MEFTNEHAFEQTLLTIKEAFIYKVPPLRTASGHRAEDWNLANPLFTGLIRVFQVLCLLALLVVGLLADQIDPMSD